MDAYMNSDMILQITVKKQCNADIMLLNSTSSYSQEISITYIYSILYPRYKNNSSELKASCDIYFIY